MKLIAHRRNTLAELRATPQHYGVEIDLRSEGSELILHHDPFAEGEPFERWIAEYRHGTLILNVKEEGLETRIIEIVERHGVRDFFFLDQSFPFLVKTALRGERRTAVRVSEFESVDTALSLADKVDWVWVDCFTRFPVDQDGWERLRRAGLRLCVVSPDLLGRTDPGEVAALRSMFASWNTAPDAVCAKLGAMAHWQRPL